MSESQRTIAADIRAASASIVEHVIKLALYPDAQECNHWRHEVYTFLNKVDRLKGKNKYPKKDFIYRWLSTHNDIIDSFVAQITSDYAEDPKIIPISKLTAVVEEYQKWLSSELSTRGFVTSKDVYAELAHIVDNV